LEEDALLNGSVATAVATPVILVNISTLELVNNGERREAEEEGEGGEEEAKGGVPE
jgi:hypothetical protein